MLSRSTRVRVVVDNALHGRIRLISDLRESMYFHINWTQRCDHFTSPEIFGAFHAPSAQHEDLVKGSTMQLPEIEAARTECRGV